MRFLVDTNILSEPCKKDPNPKVLGKLMAHQGTLAMAATTWQELLYGVGLMPPGRRRDFTETYILGLGEVMEILPYDEEAARWHADERIRLHDQRPSYEDGLIAAVAAVNNLIVVTRNVADFRPFKDLQIVNWFVE